MLRVYPSLVVNIIGTITFEGIDVNYHSKIKGENH